MLPSCSFLNHLFLPLACATFIQTQRPHSPFLLSFSQDIQSGIWLLCFLFLKYSPSSFVHFLPFHFEINFICSFIFLVNWCPGPSATFQALLQECYAVNDDCFLRLWHLFAWSPRAHWPPLTPYHGIYSCLIFCPLPPPWFFKHCWLPGFSLLLYSYVLAYFSSYVIK